MPYWGSMGVGGAAGLPIENLRGKGRAILHGEQEFIYHGGEWPHAGDVLVGEGVDLRRVREGEERRRQARVLRDRDDVVERAHRRSRSSRRSSRSRSTASPTRPSPSRSRDVTPAGALRPRRDPRRHRPLRLGDRHQGLGAARHRASPTTRTSTTRRTRAARSVRTTKCAGWLEKVMTAFPVTQHLMANIDVHARRRPRDVPHDGDQPAGRGDARRRRCTSSSSARATTTSSCAPTRGWRIAKRVETTMWFQGSLPDELLIQR